MHCAVEQQQYAEDTIITHDRLIHDRLTVAFVSRLGVYDILLLVENQQAVCLFELVRGFSFMVNTAQRAGWRALCSRVLFPPHAVFAVDFVETTTTCIVFLVLGCGGTFWSWDARADRKILKLFGD